MLKLHPSYENRVFGLDIMRALAIIFVVMGHGGMLQHAGTGFPWIRLIDGVEMFFVLSGFLIGGLLIKTFFKEQRFTFKSLGDFWVRRWFRTLPNYYLVLLLNIIVVAAGLTPEDFSQFNWKFFLFLQNFSSPFTGFFWESWSLSIEEWFYVFFPLLLLGSYLVMKSMKFGKSTIFLVAILMFLLVPLLLRVFIAADYEVDEFWLQNKIYKVVVFRLDSIAWGILASIISYKLPVFWRSCRIYTFILGIVLTYFVLYFPWETNAFSTKVFYNTLQSIGCFLLLPGFDSIRKGPRLLVKVFTHISLISYSMYLLNLGIIAQIINYNFPPVNALHAWVQYGLYWFLVIFLSTLLYRFFERPMMDLREKISPGKAPKN